MDTDRRAHATRRLVGALAHSITAVRAPALATCRDSHKMLPLLLRWAEVLDPPSRAAALGALRHCVEELPAPEVRWHSELLLHKLRSLLVFREPIVVAALLPALLAAWRVCAPALRDVADDGRAHAAAAAELLDDLERELMYAVPKRAARRVYTRELAAWAPSLGARVCTHLAALLELSYAALDAEAADYAAIAAKAAEHAAATPTPTARHRRALDDAAAPLAAAVALVDALLRAAPARAGARGGGVAPRAECVRARRRRRRGRSVVVGRRRRRRRRVADFRRGARAAARLEAAAGPTATAHRTTRCARPWRRRRRPPRAATSALRGCGLPCWPSSSPH